MHQHEKLILLIDMDGVTTDYYGGFCTEWKLRYPDRFVVPPKDLTEFYIEKIYGDHYNKDIREINTGLGFFEKLQPIQGAVEALQSILEDDEIEAFICTAPELDAVNQSCFSEKARWVEHYLGRKWLERMVLSKDKTVMHGDFLIDDKPKITGLVKPTWEQIVFSHAYNRGLPNLRLDSWYDWPKIREHILRLHYGKKEIAA